MLQRARSFFQTADTSAAVTVGVVGGLALFYTFNAIAYGFVLPIFTDALRSDSNGPLEFTLLGVTFNYQQLIVELFSLALISAVGYVLFVWDGGEVESTEPDTRDCPECKSEIWVDSRRCPYCTSAVVPLVDVAGESQVPS